jgi:RNA polymerase sigma-70 factor (ECF subfamily)
MPNEVETIEALRRGDEAAFAWLIDQYHAPLLRTALIYVGSPDVAEEVVQETWISVFKGIDRFEGRSSLKTWVFSILIKRAKTHAVREGRYQPLDSESEDGEETFEPSVSPERFKDNGHWVSFPQSWEDIPEDRLLSKEVGSLIQQTIDLLPTTQRAVITLHDIEQLPSKEVCNILGVSETNQRVLLHRARSRVRRALEHYLA